MSEFSSPIPNSQRLLESVVSVEAWHSAFDENRRADVHADIVFKTARLGQEEGAPVRFRLSLRRALVMFIIPDNEPLKVIQDSVAREQSVRRGLLSKSLKTDSAHEVGLTAEAKIRPKPTLNLSGSASGSRTRIRSSSFHIEQEIGLILVTHSKGDGDTHIWDLLPAQGSNLSGRPWDSLSQPRLSVKDTRTKATHLDGACRIDVRCKREDLLIQSIALKDQKLMKRLSKGKFFYNKLAAAESYIRDALVARGLTHGDFSEDYSDISVANVSVEPLIS